jgi:large subunit ribosomal protein L32e
MNPIKIRRKMKQAKPAFKRANWYLVRVGQTWRKPKGMHNKLRQHIRSHGWLPQAGYGSPLAAKGLHPTGLREVLVSNVAQLSELKPNAHVVRIAGSVGNAKRVVIQDAAQVAGLKVLNPRKITIRRKEKK